MTGSDSTKTPDGLEYNSKGVLIPPQSQNAWDVSTMFFAMAIPFFALQMPLHSPLPPLGLQKLAIFQVMISRDLLSSDQLGRIEFLLLVQIIARVAGFPAFFRKCARKYSEQDPPPVALARSWPRQIRLSFLALAIVIGGMHLLGILMQHAVVPYFTAKEIFLPIFIVSLGLWFVIDSMIAAVVCSYFYFKYWRHST